MPATCVSKARQSRFHQPQTEQPDGQSEDGSGTSEIPCLHFETDLRTYKLLEGESGNTIAMSSLETAR